MCNGGWLARSLLQILLYVLYVHSVPPQKDKTTLEPTTTPVNYNTTYSTSDIDAKETNIDSILCEYYSKWSKWTPCSRKCEQVRERRCRRPEQCGNSFVKEKRTCRRQKGRCSVLSYKLLGFKRKNRFIEQLLYDLLYSSWSKWSPCTRSCKQKRQRECAVQHICRKSSIQEERRCRVTGKLCERRYMLKPIVQVTNKHPREEIVNNATQINNTKNGTADEKSERKGKIGVGKLDSLEAQCGIRPPNMSGSYRIVGGQEAKKLSWPWMVAVMTRWKEQYCGATLIAPQWVLTAAHCVRKKGRKRKVILKIGELDLGEYEETELTVHPAKDFPHPDFDYATITNDIALIKLKRAVESDKIKFACLPDKRDKVRRKTLCYTIGWGKTKNTLIYGSEKLQEARVPIVNRRRCQSVFNYDITDTQVCAGYKRGGVDSCAGDSGGPLMCSRDDNNGVKRWFIYGVTSYGEGCGRKGKYGIYTKVSSYLSWIRNTIENN
ncbi:hypothetical protein SNE40_020259 [Patella caerulea]|uniref:Peptidase S1 domain-containing protein n=1 Tax=Patella caerulea TaxID=87958 RepID=A0AAN8GJX8_PATCE